MRRRGRAREVLDLAYSLGQTGDTAAALTQYQQVAEVAARVLGEESRLTRSARAGADFARLRTAETDWRGLPKELREVLRFGETGNDARQAD